MYNKVILIGNLTRDVELRYLPSGTAVAKIGLATNRRYKNQMGEQQEEVCFVDVSLFGRTAELANQYLQKGRRVMIEGRLVLEQWTDQSGQKRSRHSVTAENMQFMDSRGDQNSGGAHGDGGGYDSGYSRPPQQQPKPQSTPHNNQPSGGNQIPEIDIDEDEIPF